MSRSHALEALRAGWRREEGQTLAEYGVVLTVITIAAVAAFTGFGAAVATTVNRVVSLFP